MSDKNLWHWRDVETDKTGSYIYTASWESSVNDVVENRKQLEEHFTLFEVNRRTLQNW